MLYLGGATRFGYRSDGISGALAAIASLLPDLDLPPAKIGRLFGFISVPLERRFGHRTLTHSALMLLAVAALAAPLGWMAPLYFGSVVGGTWSDRWLDMLNVRGVDLFWPSSHVQHVIAGSRKFEPLRRATRRRLYGEHPLAPFRRKPSGSFLPESKWLHFAESSQGARGRVFTRVSFPSPTSSLSLQSIDKY